VYSDTFPRYLAHDPIPCTDPKGPRKMYGQPTVSTLSPTLWDVRCQTLRETDKFEVFCLSVSMQVRGLSLQTALDLTTRFKAASLDLLVARCARRGTHFPCRLLLHGALHLTRPDLTVLNGRCPASQRPRWYSPLV